MIPRSAILTRLAFATILSIVIARCLMLETIRSADSFTDVAAARGPGASTSIVLDWLSFVPALLILARRILDRSFAIRFTSAHALLVLLAAWTLASVFWADDRFLSLLNATRIAGGAAIFFAASQLVRRPAHLRVVVGIVIGVLLVNVVQGALYQNFDLAELKEYWTTNKAQILAAHGWREGDYVADRFEKKLLAGEMLNFSMSANVLGALVVTAALAAIGGAVQRLRDRDDAGWAGALFLVAASSAYVLAHTGSKASWAALALGVGLLGAWRLTRGWVERHRTLAFGGAIAAIGLAIVGVTAVGLARGGLPTDSLNFRWRYWVGSWPLVREHPFRGIGWGNFADFYLAHRLPAAAEEIQDPHSFPVRWLVELGGVGLALGTAWLVAWAWAIFGGTGVPAGDGTRSQAGMPVPPTGMPVPLAIPISRVLAALLPAFVLCVLCTIDFTADGSFAFLETMRRAMFVGLIALALGLVCIGRRASTDEPFHVDERPAPWLAAGLFLGVLMLLLQSTIDMALFQPGPWNVAMLAMGALLGQSSKSRDATPSPVFAGRFAREVQRRRCVAAILTIASCTWVGAGVVVARVIVAERYEQAGDLAMGRRNAHQAWLMYQYATPFSPISNFDYAAKEALAFSEHVANPAGNTEMLPTYTPRTLYAAAIAAAPHHALSWLTRSRFLSSQKDVSPVDASQAINDFARAIALNPNDVDLRVEYADLLERFGHRADAAAQLDAALALDAQLDPAEPERLALRSPGQIERLRARAAALRSTTQS